MITQDKTIVNSFSNNDFDKICEIDKFTDKKRVALDLQGLLATFYTREIYDKETNQVVTLFTKQGNNILNCGNDLIFKRYSDEEHTTILEHANFCKARLCPYCAWRWHLKYTRIINKVFELIDHNNFYHLVLTCKNLKNISNEFLKEFKTKAVYFIKQKLKVKNYLIAFEMTLSENGEYHPHYHIVLDLPSDCKYTKKQLQTTWAKILDNGQKYAIVDLKKCYGNRVSQELTKYILKCDFKRLTRTKLEEVFYATRGIKKFSTGGIFKDLMIKAKELIENDSAEKKKILEEYDNKRLFYKWLQTTSRYILSEIH